MVSFKLTHNVKPKRSEEVECDSLEELYQIIDKVFSVDKKNVKFMKPPLKVISF